MLRDEYGLEPIDRSNAVKLPETTVLGVPKKPLGTAKNALPVIRDAIATAANRKVASIAVAWVFDCASEGETHYRTLLANYIKAEIDLQLEGLRKT